MQNRASLLLDSTRPPVAPGIAIAILLTSLLSVAAFNFFLTTEPTSDFTRRSGISI